jgi:hypothetical protein
MAVTNIRGLRDSRQIKAWLRAGESIEIRDRNEVFGRILPENKRSAAKKKRPDFAARRKEIFGDRILPAVDDFLEDRHRW